VRAPGGDPVDLKATPVQLARIALWTRDFDAAAAFWQSVFGATVGEPYFGRRRPGFVSRFAVLPGDAARVELMTGPWIEITA
jgi:lactoylglutathione lyase